MLRLRRNLLLVAKNFHAGLVGLNLLFHLLEIVQFIIISIDSVINAVQCELRHGLFDLRSSILMTKNLLIAILLLLYWKLIFSK